MIIVECNKHNPAALLATGGARGNVVMSMHRPVGMKAISLGKHWQPCVSMELLKPATLSTQIKIRTGHFVYQKIK